MKVDLRGAGEEFVKQPVRRLDLKIGRATVSHESNLE
jgi:hypothetical protein